MRKKTKLPDTTEAISWIDADTFVALDKKIYRIKPDGKIVRVKRGNSNG